MKWKARQKGWNVEMQYLLLLALSLCGILMVFTGGKIYEKISRRRTEQYSSGVALHYIANQVRQNDGEGRIKVLEIEGTSVLELRQSFDGIPYTKWIYCHDGSIRELLTRQGSGLGLMDGIPVMECEGLSIVKNGRLLTVETAGRKGGTLHLYLRSEGWK